MAEKELFRGKEASVSITDQSDTDIPVGKLSGEVEVEVQREVEELRAGKVIGRLDEFVTALDINVTSNFGTWDMQTIVDLLGGTDLSSGGTFTYPDDKSDPLDLEKFTVTTTAVAQSTGDAYELEVQEVIFPNLPIGGGLEEHWILNPEGRGNKFKITFP